MTWTVAIGIDTHGDEHVAVAFDRLGRQLDARSEPASTAGYLAPLALGQRHSASPPSRSKAWAATARD